MRVLFCQWGSICEAGIAHAFSELKIDVDNMTQELKHSDYDKEYLNGLAEKLNRKKYDYVFSINFVPVISKVCNVYHQKYMCWTVDHPSLQLYSKDLENSCNRIFMFDRMQYEKFLPRNPERIFYMPLGYDDTLYHSLTVTEEEYEKYKCDISFIGSTYSEKCKYNSLVELPEYIKGYVDGLMHAQMNLYGYNLLADSLSDEFLSEFKKYADWGTLPKDYEEDTLGLIADCYIGEKCTEQERIRTLQNISAQFDMDIYTTSDMSAIPHIHNRGIADSVTMMPKIFRCSKINLNMTNRPIRSGLPQRIFDIMGAGGFLLTNYQAEIPEYFEIGKHLEIYESQEDLLQKIAYYLEHEEERRSIAENGKRLVEEGCRYAHRLQLMFETAAADGQ